MIKSIIHNSDIREIEKKSKIQNLIFDEISLLQDSKLLEWQIQANCRRICLEYNKSFEMYKIGKVKFVQSDNGGNFKISGKIRKQKEGTVAGFPDVSLIISKNLIGKNFGKKETKVIYVEFKRIGTPSQIRISDNQKKEIADLKNMGFEVYLCNNSLFFKKVIMENIEKYIRDN